MLTNIEVGVSALGCPRAGQSTTGVQLLDANQLAWLPRLDAVRGGLGCQHEYPPDAD